ncbi:MAG: hypothetical protein QME78_00125 [Thermodesulfobacteriota bacterium]|nr:hypothetical protein [Thermodesulfobacteriota bacterium]
MSESRDKLDLTERTRFRNRTVWVGLLAGTPLAQNEALINILYQDMIEGYLAITDEAFALREHQRDLTTEQSRAEIDQERSLADAKAATERERLAIKITADEYMLAARIYDAQVRGLVMAAKEYASEVERGQLALEGRRAQLAAAKEGVRLKEVNAKIYYEAIQKAMVEADLAKNQLEVAKAYVRVAMAGIDATRAELEIIEADVKQAMAAVEKATLQADVAMTYAEVVTKQLSKIKLAVEQKEIAKGFDFVRSKLTDLLGIWTVRNRIENLREQGMEDVLAEILAVLEAEKGEQDLRLTEARNAQEVFDYEGAQTAASLVKERTQRVSWVTAKERLRAVENNAKVSILSKKTWAEELTDRAQAAVYGSHNISRFETHRQTEYVSK